MGWYPSGESDSPSVIVLSYVSYNDLLCSLLSSTSSHSLYCMGFCSLDFRRLSYALRLLVRFLISSSNATSNTWRMLWPVVDDSGSYPIHPFSSLVIPICNRSCPFGNPGSDDRGPSDTLAVISHPHTLTRENDDFLRFTSVWPGVELWYLAWNLSGILLIRYTACLTEYSQNIVPSFA